ncbi:hypothetical protein LINPERPRIM_LOCUS16875 [Linum perenne]
MDALKFSDIPMVISETGWPSKGRIRERSQLNQR